MSDAIGGITPWLKTAHLAEAFNVAVCPHFLMELHVGLCAAVPNAAWVEYIPQLDAITTSRIRIENGHALPSDKPGIGIDWDWRGDQEDGRRAGGHRISKRINLVGADLRSAPTIWRTCRRPQFVFAPSACIRS